MARLETGEPGIFRQQRVGRDGVLFDVQKIRTMRSSGAQATTVTVQGDSRITRLGRILRRLKIDELPQLINVVKGDMSLVGPRPDVPGFADLLEGEDRKVLKLRPGITGPAALAYRHEEQLLQSQPDPERYNREVIWPDKVAINRQYVEGWSLRTDVHCIAMTIRSVFDTVMSTSTKEGHMTSRLLMSPPDVGATGRGVRPSSNSFGVGCSDWSRSHGVRERDGRTLWRFGCGSFELGNGGVASCAYRGGGDARRCRDRADHDFRGQRQRCHLCRCRSVLRRLTRGRRQRRRGSCRSGDREGPSGGPPSGRGDVGGPARQAGGLRPAHGGLSPTFRALGRGRR